MTRPLIIASILAALVGGLVGAIAVPYLAGAPLAPATPTVSGKTYQEMVDQQMARSRPTAAGRPRTWTPPRLPPERTWGNTGLFQESESYKRWEMERRVQKLEDRARCDQGGFGSSFCP